MKQILKYNFGGEEFHFEVDHNLPTDDEGNLSNLQIGKLEYKYRDDAFAEFLDKKQFERDPNVYYGIKER